MFQEPQHHLIKSAGRTQPHRRHRGREREHVQGGRRRLRQEDGAAEEVQRRRLVLRKAERVDEHLGVSEIQRWHEMIGPRLRAGLYTVRHQVVYQVL